MYHTSCVKGISADVIKSKKIRPKPKEILQIHHPRNYTQFLRSFPLDTLETEEVVVYKISA